jgi:Protein of unknown function (DUF3108)
MPANGQRSRTPDTIGPAAQIVPPPHNYRFPNGQTYVLAVEWHLFNAGIARVKMEPVGQQQKVSAVADSVGVVNLLYGIHDRFESYFDPRTFCSQRVLKHSEEGSHKRDTQVQFDYTRHKSVLDEKNLRSGENKRAENDIPSCITDVVTGFYYLAAQPLAVGSSYSFPLNDGGKTIGVKAQVEGREQVKVQAGTYETLRITAEPTSGPLKGKGKVWAWFSDDANHTPVQMKAKLGWGTLMFRLQRVEK